MRAYELIRELTRELTAWDLAQDRGHDYRHRLARRLSMGMGRHASSSEAPVSRRPSPSSPARTTHPNGQAVGGPPDHLTGQFELTLGL